MKNTSGDNKYICFIPIQLYFYLETQTKWSGLTEYSITDVLEKYLPGQLTDADKNKVISTPYLSVDMIGTIHEQTETNPFALKRRYVYLCPHLQVRSIEHYSNDGSVCYLYFVPYTLDIMDRIKPECPRVFDRNTDYGYFINRLKVVPSINNPSAANNVPNTVTVDERYLTF